MDGNFLKVFLNPVYMRLVFLVAEKIICLGVLNMVTAEYGAEVCTLHVFQFIWIFLK